MARPLEDRLTAIQDRFKKRQEALIAQYDARRTRRQEAEALQAERQAARQQARAERVARQQERQTAATAPRNPAGTAMGTPPGVPAPDATAPTPETPSTNPVTPEPTMADVLTSTPGVNTSRRLGLRLGLNPNQRRDARAALASGQFDQFLADNGLTDRFARRAQSDRYGERAAAFEEINKLFGVGTPAADILSRRLRADGGADPNVSAALGFTPTNVRRDRRSMMPPAYTGGDA